MDTEFDSLFDGILFNGSLFSDSLFKAMNRNPASRNDSDSKSDSYNDDANTKDHTMSLPEPFSLLWVNISVLYAIYLFFYDPVALNGMYITASQFLWFNVTNFIPWLVDDGIRGAKYSAYVYLVYVTWRALWKKPLFHTVVVGAVVLMVELPGLWADFVENCKLTVHSFAREWTDGEVFIPSSASIGWGETGWSGIGWGQVDEDDLTIVERVREWLGFGFYKW